MIDLNKDTQEWMPIEVVEHNLYSMKLDNDLVVQTMEQLQATGASLEALVEAEKLQGATAAQFTIAGARLSLSHAYRNLAMMLSTYKERIRALESYLTLWDVETASSMRELMSKQT
jgi:hypothetical protein